MVICIVSESGSVGILVCNDVGLDLSVFWLMSFFFLIESFF